MIYMDYNATAPLLPEVRDAMSEWLEERPANPSSVHRAGQRARAALESARRQIAEFVGVRPDGVVLTSGGTEANNLALWSAVGWPPAGHLVVSAVEHPSVLGPARGLADAGVDVTVLPVDADGRVDPEELRGVLTPDTRLVSIMAANNETGVLQPVGELADVAHEAGVPMHCDAVQAASWLDLAELIAGVDLVTLAGHKLGGPLGVGALCARPGTVVRPLLRGGGQQAGRRPGTEPVGLAVGLATACAVVAARREAAAARVANLRERLEAAILEAEPDAQRTGAEPRLPNTCHLTFPDCNGAALVARLDLDGLAVSGGAACSSGVPAGSHVLEAMGVPVERQGGALRLSLGHPSSEADVDAALPILSAALPEVRGRARPRTAPEAVTDAADGAPA